MNELLQLETVSTIVKNRAKEAKNLAPLSGFISDLLSAAKEGLVSKDELRYMLKHFLDANQSLLPNDISDMIIDNFIYQLGSVAESAKTTNSEFYLDLNAAFIKNSQALTSHQKNYVSSICDDKSLSDNAKCMLLMAVVKFYEKTELDKKGILDRAFSLLSNSVSQKADHAAIVNFINQLDDRAKTIKQEKIVKADFQGQVALEAQQKNTQEDNDRKKLQDSLDGKLESYTDIISVLNNKKESYARKFEENFAQTSAYLLDENGYKVFEALNAASSNLERGSSIPHNGLSGFIDDLVTKVTSHQNNKIAKIDEIKSKIEERNLEELSIEEVRAFNSEIEDVANATIDVDYLGNKKSIPVMLSVQEANDIENQMHETIQKNLDLLKKEAETALTKVSSVIERKAKEREAQLRNSELATQDEATADKHLNDFLARSDNNSEAIYKKYTKDKQGAMRQIVSKSAANRNEKEISDLAASGWDRFLRAITFGQREIPKYKVDRVKADINSLAEVSLLEHIKEINKGEARNELSSNLPGLVKQFCGNAGSSLVITSLPKFLKARDEAAGRRTAAKKRESELADEIKKLEGDKTVIKDLQSKLTPTSQSGGSFKSDPRLSASS